MGHLIKLEWLKMKNYTAFRVLSFLFVLTFPLLLIAGKRIQAPQQAQTFIDSFYSFPTVFEILGYVGNWLAFFFLGFMALLSVTNDYTNKTLRQNMLTGLSRKEFILSKLYFVAAVCGFVTLYYILIGSVFGFFNTPKIYLSDFTDSLAIFGKFYLMCFGYCVFGLLIGLIIKKTGLALFIYLAYTMFIEPGIRWGFHSRVINNSTMHYYPLNAIEDLIPNPLKDKADAFQGNFEGMTIFLSSTEAILVATIYIALFIFLLFFVINKRDL